MSFLKTVLLKNQSIAINPTHPRLARHIFTESDNKTCTMKFHVTKAKTSTIKTWSILDSYYSLYPSNCSAINKNSVFASICLQVKLCLGDWTRTNELSHTHTSHKQQQRQIALQLRKERVKSTTKQFFLWTHTHVKAFQTPKSCYFPSSYHPSSGKTASLRAGLGYDWASQESHRLSLRNCRNCLFTALTLAPCDHASQSLLSAYRSVTPRLAVPDISGCQEEILN